MLPFFLEKKIVHLFTLYINTISDHTEVKYIVNCPKVSDFPRTELEKLRMMLATLIHANYDDIIVSGVKNGCVIISFMIRKSLIPKLRAFYSSENARIHVCLWMRITLKYNIMKVMIQNEPIYNCGKFLFPLTMCHLHFY